MFFLDEHCDTINDESFFVNRLDDYQWGNLPASYHNGAGESLSFADGHMESHRWVVADTVRPPVQGGSRRNFQCFADDGFRVAETADARA